MVIFSAPAVHACTQMPQAVHFALSNTGLGQSLRGTRGSTRPAVSATALFGHARAHTPHSTQRFGLMVCFSFSVPLIAATGQYFAHNVQPSQASVML